MTNDRLEAMIRGALNEIDATPPSRLAPKTLAATVQRWDTTLAIAEHELQLRAPSHEERCNADCSHNREPNRSILNLAITLQDQIGLAYEQLPKSERDRVLATLDMRYTNAVKTHTMRERADGGQPILAGFGTLPKAS
jgi:hypothetical protein